jgi:hypothetical protein
MNYNGYCDRTSFHTECYGGFRISSIWREASCWQGGWFWETFVWYGKDIYYQSPAAFSINQVMLLHKKLDDFIQEKVPVSKWDGEDDE